MSEFEFLDGKDEDYQFNSRSKSSIDSLFDSQLNRAIQASLQMSRGELPLPDGSDSAFRKLCAQLKERFPWGPAPDIKVSKTDRGNSYTSHFVYAGHIHGGSVKETSVESVKSACSAFRKTWESNELMILDHSLQRSSEEVDECTCGSDASSKGKCMEFLRLCAKDQIPDVWLSFQLLPTQTQFFTSTCTIFGFKVMGGPHPTKSHAEACVANRVLQVLSLHSKTLLSLRPSCYLIKKTNLNSHLYNKSKGEARLNHEEVPLGSFVMSRNKDSSISFGKHPNALFPSKKSEVLMSAIKYILSEDT